MMKPNTVRKFNILGSDDSINTCDCCGKTDLKATWAVEMIETGEILHYGSVCVTRNTGIKNPESAARIYEREQMRLANIELRQSAEWREQKSKYAQRQNMNLKPGRESMEFVRAEVEAVNAKKAELMKKYNLKYMY